MSPLVKFEIAKLLKERGFDEPCRFVHDTWDNIKDWLEGGDGEHRNSHKNGSVYYSAPTIAEVVMWLYEKHGIWIACNISPDFETFSCYVVNKKIGYDTEEFNSPTEAYSQAIEYVIKNLI